MSRILLGLFVFLIAGSAQAAPLVHFWLEGRRQGSSDPFGTTVAVSTGDVVEYRLQLQMAPIGTFNDHLDGDAAQPGKHGMNSLSIAIVQNPLDQIQVDLAAPAALAAGWDRGTGARGGAASERSNSLLNDLVDIRPIRAPGAFIGATANTVLSGLFHVNEISGLLGKVAAEWGTISGGGSFDGDVFFVWGPNHHDHGSNSTEGSADPLTEFTPLALVAASAPPIPEPSVIALAGVAIGTLLVVKWRLTS
jgi:hypothetical protein